MKIIFVGTPEIACETLKVVNQHHEIVAVLTQTDKPRGRSKSPVSSEIAQLGESLGLTVYKSDKNSDELITELKQLKADLFLVFAYGVILKKDFLEIAKCGGINIHPSLLPKYRGPSPMQSAILNGDKISGITIQNIKLKVDSGDILFQKEFDIDSDEDIFGIEKKVSKLSSEIIASFLDNFEKGKITPITQDEKKVSLCKIFKKEDGLINWNESRESIINKIRAFAKWPLSYTTIFGKKLLIHSAKIATDINYSDYRSKQNGEIVISNKNSGIIVKASDGFIKLLKLQIEGKKNLDYKEFINGQKNLVGEILL